MNLDKIIFLVVILLNVESQAVPQSSDYNWYPEFHFAPQKGWMNDPNGLIYYQGYYHAFHQYNPDYASWGLMHWGHARSKDMLEWEHLPIALTPSLTEDIDGIFSGSAVNNNGTMTVMYTGVSGEHQAQCIATSQDGISFNKAGVVLRKEDDKDFRDPKVWWQNDSWFVVIGSKTVDNRGEVLLYKSEDLYNWDYQGVLAEADDKLGYMWECPDFFTLGGKQILVINPQGVEQDGYNYQNLYQTGYFVGNWIPGGQYEIEKGFREIDHGHDFYASQTFLAPDGRRIEIAWMDMWESPFPEDVAGWAGMFTLPRELSLSESGVLEVRPIREVQQRRNETPISGKSVSLMETYKVANLSTNEVFVEYNISSSTADIFGIRLGDYENLSEEGVIICVNYTASRLFLYRNYPKFNITLSSRSVPINLADPLELDIFVDNSSVEIFVNDGQAVLSSRIYPANDQKSLSFFVENGMVFIESYKVWDL